MRVFLVEDLNERGDGNERERNEVEFKAGFLSLWGRGWGGGGGREERENTGERSLGMKILFLTWVMMLWEPGFGGGRFAGGHQEAARKMRFAQRMR